MFNAIEGCSGATALSAPITPGESLISQLQFYIYSQKNLPRFQPEGIVRVAAKNKNCGYIHGSEENT